NVAPAVVRRWEAQRQRQRTAPRGRTAIFPRMTEQPDLAEATANVHAVVPILGAMGLEVVEAAPGRAAARIPTGPNVNHFGVTYAGSLFSVAEMLGGIIGGFFEVSGAIPIVQRLEIDF